MSTGNDPALPTDQPIPATLPADPNAPPVADPNRLTFTAEQPVDVDDVELQTAKTAAEAEKAAGEGEVEADAGTVKDPAQQPPAAAAPTDQRQPPQQQQPPQKVMIPKERLDEALRERDEARQAAAFHAGIAKAREGAPPAQPGQGPQPQPQQQTAAQKLEAINTATDALAQRFDAGEITMTEFKREERKLDDQAMALREEQLGARAPNNAPQQGGNDELYLDTLTARLEDEHPWVKPFNAVATESEWSFVTTKARENLQSRGIELKGTIGSYELRKEISSVIDTLSPSLIADRVEQAKAAGYAFPGAQPPSPGQQQQRQPNQLSPEAKARQDKLRLAAEQPPDLNRMGGSAGGNPGDVPTDASIEAMSEADYDKMPTPLRNKLLGISAQ